MRRTVAIMLLECLLASSALGAWQRAGLAAEDAEAQFYLVLEGFDREGLHDAFVRVSDPQHPDYGKHMSNHDIAAAFGAPKRDTETAVSWAMRHNAHFAEPLATGDAVRVRMPVASVRSALGVELESYSHPDRPGILAMRARTPPEVPAPLHGVVRHVFGLNQLPEESRHTVVGSGSEVVGGNAPARVVLGEEAVAMDSSSFPVVAGLEGDQQFSLMVGAVCPDGSKPTKQQVEAKPTEPCAHTGASFTQGIVQLHNQDTGAQYDVVVTSGARRPPLHCHYHRQENGSLSTGPYCWLATPPDASVANYAALRVLNVTLAYGPGQVYAGNRLSEPLFGMASATPQFLRHLYGVPSGARGTAAGNRVAISSFLKQFFSPGDLAAFQRAAGLPQQAVADVEGNEPNQPSSPGGEASLDVQTVSGMAPGIPLTVFSFKGTNKYAEPYSDWLHALADMDQDKIPLVISTSYGDDEFDWTGKHKKTDQDADRVNELFKTQGLRGISLFFSSGDDGVASFTARGKSTEEACKEFHPEFPASSPFVTAVGGAQMGTDAEDLCGVDMSGFLSPRCQPRERVCSSDLGGVITGGGGFSTLFSRGKDTSYQNKAVDHYLQHGQLPPSSKFHRKGRAYPDVTGIAAKFPVRINGTWTFLYGTSASTPMVASMVALINDARLNAGLPSMGFLNPFLYQTHEANPAAFNDVVSGQIACVVGHNASSRVCCDDAFRAGPGWDPASGLGSFNFPILLDHAMAAARKSHGGGSEDNDVETRVKVLEAVVGVIGALFLITAVGAVVFYLFMRHQRKNSSAYSEMSGVQQA